MSPGSAVGIVKIWREEVAAAHTSTVCAGIRGSIRVQRQVPSPEPSTLSRQGDLGYCLRCATGQMSRSSDRSRDIEGGEWENESRRESGCVTHCARSAAVTCFRACRSSAVTRAASAVAAQSACGFPQMDSWSDVSGQQAFSRFGGRSSCRTHFHGMRRNPSEHTGPA